MPFALNNQGAPVIGNWMNAEAKSRPVVAIGNAKASTIYTAGELLALATKANKYLDCPCGCGVRVSAFSEDFATVLEARCKACGREASVYRGSSETIGKRDLDAEIQAVLLNSKPKAA